MCHLYYLSIQPSIYPAPQANQIVWLGWCWRLRLTYIAAHQMLYSIVLTAKGVARKPGFHPGPVPLQTWPPALAWVWQTAAGPQMIVATPDYPDTCYEEQSGSPRGEGSTIQPPKHSPSPYTPPPTHTHIELLRTSTALQDNHTVTYSPSHHAWLRHVATDRQTLYLSSTPPPPHSIWHHAHPTLPCALIQPSYNPALPWRSLCPTVPS